MNTSSSAQPTDPTAWGPSDIASVINIGLSALVLAVNLHQSYLHRHFHSECFGEPLCAVSHDQTPADGPRSAVVLSP